MRLFEKTHNALQPSIQITKKQHFNTPKINLPERSSPRGILPAAKKHEIVKS